MPLKSLPEADLEINKNALDDEAATQPRRMRIWTRILADAKKATREAKNQLAVVAAEVRNKVRTTAPAKITKDEMDDAMVRTKAYADALKAYSDAEYEEDVYDGYVKSLHSRDYNISNLTKLYALGVFQITGADPATRQRALQERAAYEANRAAQPDPVPPRGRQ